MISVRLAGTTISGYSDRPADVKDDYSVLSLNRRVSQLLDTAFPPSVWLRGVLAATPKVNPRGHMYFQLVEPSPDPSAQPDAVISCALFAGSRTPIVREFARRGLVFDLKEGSEVRLQGRVTLWDKGGRYQFIVERVDPDWAGSERVAALRALVDLFTREDILGVNGELPMPQAPLRVGLITARGSAACEDFLHGLRNSGFPFRVFAGWAPMQGANTSRGVLEAFRSLLTVQDLDVAVLTRGGGSATDLGWFNDEDIGRMISQVPWPVISGIGHETDTTLPDFVGHTRAKTPTDAADILVNIVASLLDDLFALGTLLQRSTSTAVHRAAKNLTVAGTSLTRAVAASCRAGHRELDTIASWMGRHTLSRIRTEDRLHNRLYEQLVRNAAIDHTTIRRSQLEDLTARLRSAANSRIRTSSLLLNELSAKVSGSDPVRLYRSGWATVRDADGERIRRIADLGTNDRIRVRMFDGRIDAVVEGTDPADGTDPGGADR